MAADLPDTETLDPQDERRQQECAQRWIGELGVSEKAQRPYMDRCKKITARYKRERSTTDVKRGYAMLWSNTQTVQPAIYARPPEPLVSRRFKDADPVARVASEILERCLSYSADKQDIDGTFRTCSFDFTLLARGQTWERYIPTHGPMVTPEIELQVVTGGGEGEESTYTDDEGKTYKGDDVKARDNGTFYAEGEPYKPVVFEESRTDYVNWSDFGTSVARTWDEVTYVWRRVYLSREQLIKRFGEKLGKLVPLDWGPIEQGPRDEAARLQKKAAVYEIWDKTSRKVFWISKSWSSRPLDERDDPLGLDEFFPCPRPLTGTTASDSIIPIPDYVYYQDQAEEIDELTARIAVLEKAVKVRGFYAAVDKTNLANLFESSTSTMIPVVDWRGLKEDGGINGKIEWFPIDKVVQALNACIELRAQLIEDVYQITGVADILRGASDPRETAAAQNLKAQWGAVRVRDRQIEMMRFCRDALRIKGEVIAEKFSADTLKAMSGVQLPTRAEKQALELQIEQAKVQVQAAQQQAQATGQQPPPLPEIPPEIQKVLSSPTWEDVEELLHNNAMRQFRIDIETDSTIEPNEQAEKTAIIELTTALGSFIAEWGPAVAAQPQLAPVAGELIKTAVRKFRAGRELESVIDTAMDAIMAAPPPQGEAAPPVDQTPVQVATIEQQTAQMEQQEETRRAMMQQQIDAEELRLRQGDQQIKLVAINRDPTPQALA